MFRSPCHSAYTPPVAKFDRPVASKDRYNYVLDLKGWRTESKKRRCAHHEYNYSCLRSAQLVVAGAVRAAQIIYCCVPHASKKWNYVHW